ncbi:MAG: tetratricopeptide repeat protein [Magnetococcus sp. DMHC-8]
MSMDALLDQFCRVIGAHTGLIIPEHDLPYLREKLSRRLQVTRVGTEERYLALLTGEDAAGEAEWRELVLELTTGESYFFRDAGQMRLLREVIFPGLLRLRAAERTLRIWSAGCSTGEEPYSLAIMLQLLLAGAGSWDVSIRGTDINEYALQRARDGRYSRWAFRGVSEEVVGRHFHRRQGEWQLDRSVREMVSFERLNLIKELFPDPVRGLVDLDLIVCRNVFIYFSHDAIAGIMARFAASLRPGGYVLTGHAEVQQPVSQLVASGVLPLEIRQFPDSVIFQRPMAGDPRPVTRRQRMAALSSAEPVPVSGRTRPTDTAAAVRRGVGVSGPAVPLMGRGDGARFALPSAGRGAGLSQAAVARPSGPSAEQGLREARVLLAQGRYGEAIRLADGLREVPAVAGDVCLLLARCHANLGETVKAEGCCRDALRHRPFAAEPHFLLASLLHDRGDLAQTRDLLNKTLYLDHAHVPAYLHLATLYQEEGIPDRARQMRLGALDVLRGLGADERVEHYEEWTVKELVAQLEKLLGESVEAGSR